MAIDKAIDSAALDAAFTAIGEAIREKNGLEDTYTPDQMPEAIRSITTGSPTGFYTVTLDPGSNSCYRTKLVRAAVTQSTYEQGNLSADGTMLMCTTIPGTYVVYLYTTSSAGGRSKTIKLSDTNPHVTVKF